MDKRELIETLVEVLGEDSWPELQAIVIRAIQAQQNRLDRLRKLSAQMNGNSRAISTKESELLNLTIPKNGSTKGAIYKIMQEAGRPLSNDEIRKRYYVLYGKEISSSLVGNTLWKGKNKLYKNDDNGRWSKWELIKKD